MFTSVERKSDGQLVYIERGSFLRFFNQQYKFYKINSSTYNKLKIFAVVEILIVIFLVIYFKSTTYQYSILELFLILMFGALFDIILIFLRTQLVKIQKNKSI